jgi:hypothetical protein
MTQSLPGSSDPVVAPEATPQDAPRDPVRARRMSLSLRMDDGQTRTFELPAALDRPAQFSVGELERLTRAYAEALGLLAPKSEIEPI